MISSPSTTLAFPARSRKPRGPSTRAPSISGAPPGRNWLRTRRPRAALQQLANRPPHNKKPRSNRTDAVGNRGRARLSFQRALLLNTKGAKVSAKIAESFLCASLRLLFASSLRPLRLSVPPALVAGRHLQLQTHQVPGSGKARL